MLTTIPTVRVFRARSGETIHEARLGRAELVTLDTEDLVRVVSRCQTTLTSSEAASVRRAAPRIPAGAPADIVLARGGQVFVELR
jgi:hypothetical protein